MGETFWMCYVLFLLLLLFIQGHESHQTDLVGPKTRWFCYCFLRVSNSSNPFKRLTDRPFNTDTVTTAHPHILWNQTSTNQVSFRGFGQQITKLSLSELLLLWETQPEDKVAILCRPSGPQRVCCASGPLSPRLPPVARRQRDPSSWNQNRSTHTHTHTHTHTLRQRPSVYQQTVV